MNLLTIDTAECKKCGICVEICPVSVISLSDDGYPFIPEDNEERCVLCGHCEAICTTSALKHNHLPETNFIQNDKLKEITSENIGEYFRSRRSIRAFRPKAVEKPLLENVFSIVNFAPTGVNRQRNKWLIISDQVIIRRLSEGVIDWMKTIVSANPDIAQRLGATELIASYEQGDDVICRNAPNLVIGYTDAAYSGGATDAVIATSHLELLLPAFGLGGCWAGYLMIALKNSPDVRQIVGLNDSDAVHSALMVGYPKYRYHKIPSRKKAQATWL